MTNVILPIAALIASTLIPASSQSSQHTVRAWSFFIRSSSAARAVSKAEESKIAVGSEKNQIYFILDSWELY